MAIAIILKSEYFFLCAVHDGVYLVGDFVRG